jgi:hypothetical protein
MKSSSGRPRDGNAYKSQKFNRTVHSYLRFRFSKMLYGYGELGTVTEPLQGFFRGLAVQN